MSMSRYLFTILFYLSLLKSTSLLKESFSQTFLNFTGLKRKRKGKYVFVNTELAENYKLKLNKYFH